MEAKSFLDLSSSEWVYHIRYSMPQLSRMIDDNDLFEDFLKSLKVYVGDALARKGSALLRRQAADVILEMIDNDGRVVMEYAEQSELSLSTLRNFWLGMKIDNEINSPDFYYEIYMLFTQLLGREFSHLISDEISSFMHKWAVSGDKNVEKIMQENKERIKNLLVEDISRRSADSRYCFTGHTSLAERRNMVDFWWDDYRFHLAMAVRNPADLNRYLAGSLSSGTMQILYDARLKHIPFFVTPYYLSLLNTGNGYDDATLRSYVIYTSSLVENFGSIRAWEREDEVEPGRPNAAGWILPDTHSIHRRYPEVAILIPDTMGRACGGLCASCQRMYGFQSGKLNFNFDGLKPRLGWRIHLQKMLEYFENDPQLKDILITGGDALMSRNTTLEILLDEVCQMAARKRQANVYRAESERLAEIRRIRLGTRLPAYLPCRVDEQLIGILAEARKKGLACGISQFIIQTHFQSPLEITAEAREAVQGLLSAGWIVTNQLVFNVAASRLGHTAQLRKVLNDIGVVPYYTFSVKGFDENYECFAPNARSVQEMCEEKCFGILDSPSEAELMGLLEHPQELPSSISQFLDSYNLPFIATDRNVMNLPGIGKSMTYRMLGVDKYGRRILSFSYDHSRSHSPAVTQLSDIIIRERKSIAQYLRQVALLGEDWKNYSSIWQYRSSQTEPRFRAYEYPDEKKVQTHSC